MVLRRAIAALPLRQTGAAGEDPDRGQGVRRLPRSVPPGGPSADTSPAAQAHQARLTVSRRATGEPRGLPTAPACLPAGGGFFFGGARLGGRFELSEADVP